MEEATGCCGIPSYAMRRPCQSMSAQAIWHSSRLNNCLTRVTKEKKASDKGIRQNL
jgi:hypothetical protein